MYSFYYNDIQTFRSLNQRCIISNKIITDLLSKLHAKSHAPKKTEQPLVFDVDNIKKALLEVLQTIPHSPHNYFSKYYNRLFFEIIFEIYHYAQIELQKSQERTSIKDSINQIAAFKNSVVDSSSIEQDISRKKKILVNDFNTNPEVKVFLISLKAGGTGLNLIGADMVIHYDPWWNMSAENQATDRAYRIGQKNNVQVYKLITKNSIEEKIYELQEKKSKLIDNMLSTQTTFINKLNKEDILELFN